MSTIAYMKFKKDIINIIENNEPIKAYLKISKMDNPDPDNPEKKQKIGAKGALKIYELYADKSVKYDMELHGNNISSFMKKVRENINIVKEAHKKNKKN